MAQYPGYPANNNSWPTDGSAYQNSQPRNITSFNAGNCGQGQLEQWHVQEEAQEPVVYSKKKSYGQLAGGSGSNANSSGIRQYYILEEQGAPAVLPGQQFVCPSSLGNEFQTTSVTRSSWRTKCCKKNSFCKKKRSMCYTPCCSPTTAAPCPLKLLGKPSSYKSLSFRPKTRNCQQVFLVKPNANELCQQPRSIPGPVYVINRFINCSPRQKPSCVIPGSEPEPAPICPDKPYLPSFYSQASSASSTKMCQEVQCSLAENPCSDTDSKKKVNMSTSRTPPLSSPYNHTKNPSSNHYIACPCPLPCKKECSALPANRPPPPVPPPLPPYPAHRVSTSDSTNTPQLQEKMSRRYMGRRPKKTTYYEIEEIEETCIAPPCPPKPKPTTVSFDLKCDSCATKPDVGLKCSNDFCVPVPDFCVPIPPRCLNCPTPSCSTMNPPCPPPRKQRCVPRDPYVPPPPFPPQRRVNICPLPCSLCDCRSSVSCNMDCCDMDGMCCTYDKLEQYCSSCTLSRPCIPTKICRWDGNC